MNALTEAVAGMTGYFSIQVFCLSLSCLQSTLPLSRVESESPSPISGASGLLHANVL